MTPLVLSSDFDFQLKNAESWSSNPIDISTNTPTSKVQGPLWKREQTDFKSQRNREFELRFCLWGHKKLCS